MMLDELTRVSRVGVGDDAFLQELAGRVLRAATIVRKQSTATARLRERAAGQPWDTVIRVLAFLLLPIALALPIAKVTAGLRGWIPDDPR
jgi:K+-transporting ATPase A subunit